MEPTKKGTCSPVAGHIRAAVPSQPPPTRVERRSRRAAPLPLTPPHRPGSLVRDSQSFVAEFIGTMFLTLTIALCTRVPNGYIAVGFTLGA